MSIRAILTTLILGSSTIAVAQPGSWNHDERRDRDRDHDRDRDRNRSEWWRQNGQNGYSAETSILAPTHLDRRLSLNMRGKLSGMSALRIEPRGEGRTRIDRVTVIYSDRQPQQFTFNRNLDSNDQALQVPLSDAKDVTRVIVTGRSFRGASIEIDAV